MSVSYQRFGSVLRIVIQVPEFSALDRLVCSSIAIAGRGHLICRQPGFDVCLCSTGKGEVGRRFVRFQIYKSLKQPAIVDAPARGSIGYANTGKDSQKGER